MKVHICLDLVEAKVRSGRANYKIAEDLGVCASTIDRAVRKLTDRSMVKRRDALVRRRSAEARNRACHEHDSEIVELLRNGATHSSIHELFGVSLKIIGKLAKVTRSCRAPGHYVLTSDEVENIRRQYQEEAGLNSCRLLASRYGVSHETIAQVVRGLTRA